MGAHVALFRLGVALVEGLWHGAGFGAVGTVAVLGTAWVGRVRAFGTGSCGPVALEVLFDLAASFAVGFGVALSGGGENALSFGGVAGVPTHALLGLVQVVAGPRCIALIGAPFTQGPIRVNHGGGRAPAAEIVD